MPPEDVCGISRNFSRLSPCEGQVAYALLTRAPVADRSVATPSLPLDLHVLSLSLAFILSQDQTLHTKIIFQKSYLAGSCVHRISTRVDSDSRSLRCVHLNILKNSLSLVFSRSRSSLPSPLSKAAAKVRLVFHSPNFSSFFFKLFFSEASGVEILHAVAPDFAVAGITFENSYADRAAPGDPRIIIVG